MRQDTTLEPLVALNTLSARHEPALFPVQTQNNSPFPRKERGAFSGHFTGRCARCSRAAGPAPVPTLPRPAPAESDGALLVGHGPCAPPEAARGRAQQLRAGAAVRAEPCKSGRPLQPEGPRPSRRPSPPHLRAGAAGAGPRSSAGPPGETARPGPPPCPRCPPAAPDDDVTGAGGGAEPPSNAGCA